MREVMIRKDHTSIGCYQILRRKNHEWKRKSIELVAAICLIVAGVSLFIITL